VRFIRLGTFALDIDIFAYASAHDWSNFLEIQEELLFGIMDIVEKAGARIAFPSQTTYLATDTSDKLSRPFASPGEERDAEQVA
jgi:MscS family membrane protein